MIKLDWVAPLIADPLPATTPLCREADSPKQKFISLLYILFARSKKTNVVFEPRCNCKQACYAGCRRRPFPVQLYQ